jgi:glycosyltransferase involved in cell wall biosynthesis
MIQNVRIGPSKAKILLDVLVFFKAIQMLMLKRYDVIHTHEEASFFGMFLAKIFRTRHLYDMHSVLSKQLSNFSFGNKPIFIKIFHLLESMVLKTCDAVITVGPDLEKFVKFTAPGVRVVMIENIALQAYKTSVQPDQVTELKKQLNINGRLPIVYAGTYEPYQGLDMALDAVTIVAKQYPNVLFIFLGAVNQQAEYWTQIASERDVQEHVLFLDAVSPEESMVYLAYASILISPRLDGTTTPLKIYSYLHAEKPIVATNITAHTQVLTEETAVLVEPDKESFAKGIMHVIDDPALAERIAKNAAECARLKFNQQDYLSKVNNLYKQLVPGPVIEESILTQQK